MSAAWWNNVNSDFSWQSWLKCLHIFSVSFCFIFLKCLVWNHCDLVSVWLISRFQICYSFGKQHLSLVLSCSPRPLMMFMNEADFWSHEGTIFAWYDCAESPFAFQRKSFVRFSIGPFCAAERATVKDSTYAFHELMCSWLSHFHHQQQCNMLNILIPVCFHTSKA